LTLIFDSDIIINVIKFTLLFYAKFYLNSKMIHLDMCKERR